MRPISLTVEGLRSFRKAITIDFTDRNQLAIIGDTGAGKSSILEAITYALYRQTSFSKQPNQELINASATQMRVVLKFAVAGGTWVATRALKRTKDGVASVPPTLQRFGDDGKVVESLAGTAEVAARIQRLVGLDGDAFLRTVILPQGNFARLLIADKPADRSTVLRQVWRTDELETVGEVASLKATETKELHVRLKAAAARYPEDPDEHLGTLRENRAARRREARRARQDLDEVGAAMVALQNADKENELCQDVLQRVEGVAVMPLTIRADQIAQDASEIAREEVRLSREVATIRNKLKELAQDDDGALLAAIGETIATLDRVELCIANTDKAARSLRDLSVKAEAARGSTDKTHQDEEGHRRDAERHHSGKDALDNTLTAANAQRTKVSERYAACATSGSNLAAAKCKLLDLQEKVESQTALTTKLDEEVEARRQTKERMDALLAAANRTDFAASAARGLHAGDECPVCTQTLPRAWQAPVNTDIDDAEAAATAAGHALEDAQKRAASVQATLAAGRSKKDDAEQVVGASEVEFSNALQALQELVPDLPSELPAEEIVLDPLDEELERAKETVAQHDLKQKALDQALADAKSRTAAAKATAMGLASLVDAANDDFVDSTKDVKRELEKLRKPFQLNISVPDEWRGFGLIDRTDLDRKRAVAKARQTELLEKDRERKALEGERKELEAKQKQSLNRHRQQVVDPLELLCGEANVYVKDLTLAVGKLGVDQRSPDVVAGADVAQIRSGLAGIQATLEAVRKSATDRVGGAIEVRETANARLAKFAERLNVAEGDWQAVADAVDKASEGTRLLKLRSEEEFDGFDAIVNDVRRLQALLAETTARLRALTDLAGALKDGGFLKWLTLRRSRSLLSHASVMLKQMSGDRYAFAEPDEADAPWQVLDNDSGQARSPASLSGGEQFIASLALALGMVEMMARSGGRLESLFLDEGFGSLDRNNLDAAVEALAMVASGGRVVGVISHVRAVAEQFENVLAVTRAEGGSQARWLTDSQRREMAEDALAGLLD